MKSIVKVLFVVSALASAAQVAAQVTFYENEGFAGRSYTTHAQVVDARGSPLNNSASSVIVAGQRWQACERPRFRGRCVVLRPGQYPSLTAMGMDDRLSSVRPVPPRQHVADDEYAPMPLVAQDFRRRNRERLFDAEVTSVRAVLGTPAQRCWVERAQLPVQQQATVNVPGAAVGAIIGGILGHQVGGGSGRQVATVAGAAGGAALGSQYGRNEPPQFGSTHDVRRCDGNPAQATPDYWDVIYRFRGQEHRVQMATAPGRTITVNQRGEPRA